MKPKALCTRRRPTRLGRLSTSLKEAGVDLDLEPIDKWDFYPEVSTADHVLTIQTADQQRFANLLLHVGVRMD